ncbi:hypothetical protein BRYFOR_06812 [Marvinbryantia formatexigens DSM 14469]|uniref:Stage 0 sporulation protein A homolog n=1 Tax=Marvinbryantia formatexigens DSM 14469 TaxID=478749 RepID=C6LDW3_9FIRM|nr:LytTR family DNA-binding domain-containing protein [Marvinbryantia formatexigens]EET61167.1 hypothetical protein BRYFOR_06812 [Marvinbryantia formatexigens DSM 14469]UWO23733.1 LytTR family DNA-binding domain-containing protein [Marvinbryantia formatexigens DSM 14469]SDF68537.1 two component transcriptional regulator, LytTR family [Marvinbryantia formatexigens]
MRVAVIDDEKEVRDKLTKYIRRFSEESGVKMEVSTFPSGDALLAEYQQVWDILIFDIDMPGTNGMETSKKIRKRDKNVTILFITNVAQYAIDGYGVDAVDYILKPINYYEFSMKFHRTVAKAAHSRERAVMVDTIEGTRRIRIKEVEYVEVLAHYIYIHTQEREFKARGNMKEWEEELKPFGFSRVHKSYLVNMAKVEGIQGKELTVAGHVIPVSRNYRDSFMQDYMKFYRGE